jgi:predicted house-cleaning NTP pyrophosphatase (Maf/HAM1 superfamily)
MKDPIVTKEYVEGQINDLADLMSKRLTLHNPERAEKTKATIKELLTDLCKMYTAVHVAEWVKTIQQQIEDDTNTL